MILTLVKMGGVVDPPVSSGIGLENVLAITLMELVKVLQLGGLERQVVRSQRNPGTHNHKLSLEVLHHVSKEVIRHAVEFLVRHLCNFQRILELIAQADN